MVGCNGLQLEIVVGQCELNGALLLFKELVCKLTTIAGVTMAENKEKEDEIHRNKPSNYLLLPSSELWFGWGYRAAVPQRGSGCSVYRGGSAQSLAVTVKGFTALPEELRLVNPFVRVHLLNIATGRYAKSHKRANTAIPPATTGY